MNFLRLALAFVFAASAAGQTTVTINNQTRRLQPTVPFVVFPPTAIRMDDTDASHQLIFTNGSNLTANRTLTIKSGDANLEVDFTGAAVGNSLSWNGTKWAPAAGVGSGTVTSVGQLFTGGLISVGGSPITGSGTLALTVAGTSGGIPYFSSGTTWASSGALGAGALLLGGGAGAAPTALTAGATTEILVGGGAATAPVWTTATGTGAPVRAGSPTFTGTPAVNNTAGTAGNVFTYARNSISTLLYHDAVALFGTSSNHSFGLITNNTQQFIIDPSGNAVLTGIFTTPNVRANNTAGTLRGVTARTASVDRWFYGAETTAESGSNAGSNFIIRSFDDAGTLISTPLTIVRSTGATTFASTVVASNLSGTNTGDQTITLTGDATGAGTGPFAITLATVNSNVGTFGSATASPQITINAKGLVTAGANVTITPAVGSITGLGADVAIFLATPSSANLSTAVTGKTGSGALVFGTSPAFTTAFTLANGSSPTTGAVAVTAFDTDAWAASRGAIQIHDGTANTYAVAALASDTPTNGQVPTWNTGGTVTWETPTGGTPGNNSALFTATASAAVDNTTTETTLIGSGVGSKTTAANYFAAGTSILVRLSGYFSTPAIPDNLTIRIKAGGTTVGSAVFTLPLNLTNQVFVIETLITCRTAGASGTFMMNDMIMTTNATLAATISAAALNTSAVTLDTTGTLAWDVTADWGAAQSGEIITGTNFVMFTPGTGIADPGANGVLYRTALNTVSAATSSTVGQVLRVTGPNTYALGALDLADTDAVTGVLPVANQAVQIAARLGSHTTPDTTAGAITWTASVYEVFANTTTEYDLPAASTYDGKALIVYNTGSNVITIDPNGSEVIVRDGTVQTGGVTMTLTAGAGNYVCLICDGVRWISLGFKGTLAAGS